MISVILCVNRSTPFLAPALHSILNQDFRDFEFLIGANACPDELLQELEKITAGDERVRIVRSGVPQLTYNLNMLVDLARSEWLVRMDADDVSEPSRLREIHQAISSTDADVVGSWATLIDENDRATGKFEPETTHNRIRRAFPFRVQLFHPTVAFRKTLWTEMRGYLGGFVSEDYDLWLRAINSGRRFANIPKHLVRYRVHSTQVSGTRRGYAEVAAHWYRELLYRPSWFNLVGWTVATVKLILKGRK